MIVKKKDDEWKVRASRGQYYALRKGQIRGWGDTRTALEDFFFPKHVKDWEINFLKGYQCFKQEKLPADLQPQIKRCMLHIFLFRVFHPKLLLLLITLPDGMYALVCGKHSQGGGWSLLVPERGLRENRKTGIIKWERTNEKELWAVSKWVFKA